MKSTDRLLAGIVAGVVLLVSVAFAVALLRPKPTYRPDDTPDGAAHNYLFALQQQDYARAYSYLSPSLPGYPASAAAFARTVKSYSWVFDSSDASISLEIVSVRRNSNDSASVSVREDRFRSGGLFDSQSYIKRFDMTLQQDQGKWQIVAADAYWASCWDRTGGCR